MYEIGLSEDYVRLINAELLRNARMGQIPGIFRSVGQLSEKPLRGGVNAKRIRNCGSRFVVKRPQIHF
jgi:hypothetical protein